uniref:Dihydromethanophenazine:CoB--CoM heterodisulfide reductase subunit D n=1 Tax=Candidatus Methanophagaceae archaeon ANME-1 ERB6 TaxID=2759912 RepID=A0A7G9YWX8_9EURY|nr:dihydromethanophenazine:CoB--CoM heterodisulfide reductase subunit D [Methanosarcinales archaeon ANME-1 ERB6]
MELEREEKILSAIHHCVKCKLCSIASFHPNEEWLPLCPSGEYYGYQAFYAPGKMEIFRAILEGEITEPSEGLLNAVYACTVCGACYEKCKQITSVELGAPELFEEMRREMASKGWLLDVHTSIADKIEETKNAYGEKYEYKVKAETTAGNADVLYYIGCTARYRVPEIADAMLGIFDKLGLKYQVMGEEWCCGSVLFRTGQVEAAKELVAHNFEEIKKSGAKTVVFTCPGCLKTFEKNYPDMGVELLHSTQFLTRQGDMNLKKEGLKVAYHDPCHLGRDLGIYEEPRAVLSEVADIKEMKREREQAWCCGSGGGVKSAFDDFALWSAAERLKEAREAGAEALVSACPFCKRNLKEAAEKEQQLEVYDIVELVNRCLEG